MCEIWRTVPEHSDYRVSNLGNVEKVYIWDSKISLERLPINKAGNRTPYISLDNAKLKLSHLVATLFVPNPNNYTMVYHKNGVLRDNRADNLIWVNNPRNYPVLCVELNHIFDSLDQACEFYHIPKTLLSKMIKDGSTFKGLHFTKLDK